MSRWTLGMLTASVANAFFAVAVASGLDGHSDWRNATRLCLLAVGFGLAALRRIGPGPHASPPAAGWGLLLIGVAGLWSVVTLATDAAAWRGLDLLESLAELVYRSGFLWMGWIGAQSLWLASDSDRQLAAALLVAAAGLMATFPFWAASYSFTYWIATPLEAAAYVVAAWGLLGARQVPRRKLA